MSHSFLRGLGEYKGGLYGSNYLPTAVGVTMGVLFERTKCTWVVQRQRFMHGPEPDAVDKLIPVGPQPLDAWEVRRQFLAANSLEKMLAMLRETGVFWRDNETLLMSDLEALQSGFRHMLTVDHGRWDDSSFRNQRALTMVVDSREFTLHFTWPRIRLKHAALVTVGRTLDAMIATILLDKLRGAKCGFCERCGFYFEKKSKHGRKYCGPDCAHAVAVARYRSRNNR